MEVRTGAQLPGIVSGRRDRRHNITFMLQDLSMSSGQAAQVTPNTGIETREAVGDQYRELASKTSCCSPAYYRRSRMQDATRSSHSIQACSPTVALRIPRQPRPIYSEEQKFFIMFARIIQEKAWPEIEDTFIEQFGVRTKGGLTSVYYRIRRKWVR